MNPHLKEFDAEIDALAKVKPASMSVYQKKLLDLNKKLNLVRLLVALRSCLPRSGLTMPWTI